MARSFPPLTVVEDHTHGVQRKRARGLSSWHSRDEEKVTLRKRGVVPKYELGCGDARPCLGKPRALRSWKRGQNTGTWRPVPGSGTEAGGEDRGPCEAARSLRICAQSQMSSQAGAPLGSLRQRTQSRCRGPLV